MIYNMNAHMNMKIKLLQNIPLFVIIILASCFRLAYLDRVPTAINGDELLYAITAKSVFLTGRDLTGTWNPLSAFIFRYPPNEQQAELPYAIHLLFSAPFPFSLFTTKLPFALMSVSIVILLYKIAQLLFGKEVGIATGLAAAVNPWLVVMGRTSYESTPATFFYLLALYMLSTFKNWRLLFSVIPFILAFYSYIGTKLIFVPFVILALFLGFHIQKRKYGKQYVIVGICCLLFVVCYLLLLKTSPTSRMSELVLPNSSIITSQVNEIRKTAIRSPVIPFMANRYTVYVQTIVAKLLRIFSPTYLFVEGDQFFLPGRQSFFYFIDAIFIALGSLFLFTKKRLYFVIIYCFILMGTFPHLFHKTTGDFSGHLALMFPFIIMVVGAGIVCCIEGASKRIKKIIIAGISILYICNIASFSLIYFSQYPLMGYGDFHMRVLSR
jgi:4-amino-4-deoxy-L-arabinose transferase-like glycosyltransferase